MHLKFFLLHKHNSDGDKEAESSLSNVIEKILESMLTPVSL